MLIWLIQCGHLPSLFYSVSQAASAADDTVNVTSHGALGSRQAFLRRPKYLHPLIPPMSLKYETGHGGKCRDRSSWTADSAARGPTLSLSLSTPNRASQRSDFCRTANSTVISTHHAMRAVLPNLIFDTPAVASWRPTFVFWVPPLSRHYERSRNAPGGCRVGCRGPCLNCHAPLLTDLACDLPLHAIERREREIRGPSDDSALRVD
jgi:hypothetical protein